MKPRLRMIAGPNGSGKTTLTELLRREIPLPLGFELNPDDIEAQLRSTGRMSFKEWGMQFTAEDLNNAIKRHPLSSRLPTQALTVLDNTLILGTTPPGGYLAAILSDILRRQWLAQGDSFAFETVMSSEDKVDVLKIAQAKGYRTYLYYVCTDDVRINRDRVAVRVKLGGHAVPDDKIEARYSRSLALLSRAVAASDRAYLFDNSEKEHRLVGEYDANRLVRVAPPLPEWFVTRLLNSPI